MTGRLPLRIDSGFRLAEGTDPFEFCQQVRDALNPVRDRLDASWLATYATGLIDEARFGTPRPMSSSGTSAWLTNVDPYRRPLTTALLAWHADQATRRPIERGHDPHQFEMSLGRDQQTHRVVGVAFCEQETLLDAFLALPQVEDYRYNTFAEQPPEGVTTAQWAERGRIWGELYPGPAPAVESGIPLTFKLRADHEIGMMRLAQDPANPLLADSAPSEPSRAQHLLVPAIIVALGTGPGDARGLLSAVHSAQRIADGNLQPIISLLQPITVADLDGSASTDPARADALHVELASHASRLAETWLSEGGRQQ